MASPSLPWAEMRAAAVAAAKNAYCPISNFPVGAALLGANGKIYAGCNIENASFGATLCAERSAGGAMVTDGCRELRAVYVVTPSGGSPCGICRQFLVEFAPNPLLVPVACSDQNGNENVYSLGELLPNEFRLPEK